MPRLSPTSYVVLGLIASLGPSTSYELKRAVQRSIGEFWSFPHSQLYAEPARLAEGGLLEEEREQGGRRRRTYRLTESGREALARWLGEPTNEAREVRDLALLKLFFADQGTTGDVGRLAAEQADVHRGRLARFRTLDASLGPG